MANLTNLLNLSTAGALKKANFFYPSNYRAGRHLVFHQVNEIDRLDKVVNDLAVEIERFADGTPQAHFEEAAQEKHYAEEKRDRLTSETLILLNSQKELRNLMQPKPGFLTPYLINGLPFYVPSDEHGRRLESCIEFLASDIQPMKKEAMGMLLRRGNISSIRPFRAQYPSDPVFNLKVEGVDARHYRVVGTFDHRFRREAGLARMMALQYSFLISLERYSFEVNNVDAFVTVKWGGKNVGLTHTYEFSAVNLTCVKTKLTATSEAVAGPDARVERGDWKGRVTSVPGYLDLFASMVSTLKDPSAEHRMKAQLCQLRKIYRDDLKYLKTQNLDIIQGWAPWRKI